MKTKLLILISLAFALHARAGSATWNLNPASNDWNTAANWTPATVPNMPADTATFGVSNKKSISTSAGFGLNGMVFNPGASAYTISTSDFIDISGTGIVNNSGVTQNIIAAIDTFGDFGDISFTNNATSGESVNYDVKGGPFSDFIGGEITFYDNSSAGSGDVFTTSGGLRGGASGSEVNFEDDSTAAGVTFILQQRRTGSGLGRHRFFRQEPD
jgi:hypothetical protein